MSAAALESAFVQRERLAKRLITVIRESALTESKHHSIVIGPRGSGKTHLLAVVYHRLKDMQDLHNRLIIAWLREDEWGITTFLDLVVRILRVIQADYPTLDVGKSLETIYTLSPDAAERHAVRVLKDIVGSKTLLVILENLDEVFENLGTQEQERFRAFLQEHSFSSILASAQGLFNGVSLQTSPFYGFFRIAHLRELGIDEAVELLARLARMKGDEELASFIKTPTGRARVRAVHHLAGGNHRVYAIFSDFLSRDSLDQLVGPFLRTMDDLTPYYQARMAWLSGQQRKAVEFLCDRGQAVTVKEIAARTFMSHQTASSQLKTLRERGYVRSIRIGRESFYELREPLMRLCLDIKKHRGEPVGLFVEFLRIWYPHVELKRRLTLLDDDSGIDREYLQRALEPLEGEAESVPLSMCSKEFAGYLQDHDFEKALRSVEELIEMRGNAVDWYQKGHCLVHLERWEEALTALNRSLELDSTSPEAWDKHAWALGALNRFDEALTSHDRALELNPQKATAWHNKASTLLVAGQLEAALEAFKRVTELDARRTSAWGTYGSMLASLRKYDDALAAFERMIEVSPSDQHAWRLRGQVLLDLGRSKEAIEHLQKAAALAPDDPSVWNTFGNAFWRLEQWQDALDAFNKVCALTPRTAGLWYNQGSILLKLRKANDARVAFENAIKIDETYAIGWLGLADAHRELGDYENALSAIQKAMNLGDHTHRPYFAATICLLAMARYDAASTMLKSALETSDKEGEGGHLEWHTYEIVDSMQKLVNRPAQLTNIIQLLRQVYRTPNHLLALGQALVSTITSFKSGGSRNALDEWVTTWHSEFADQAEFSVPLKLLEGAASFIKAGDPRALLGLPVEQRKVLEQLLDVRTDEGSEEGTNDSEVPKPQIDS